MAVYVPATDILYVDNTTLTTWKACKTRAMIRYGYNLAPVEYLNTPMMAGIALHKAIESYYMFNDKEAAINTFLAEYTAYARQHIEDPEDRYNINNMARVIDSWAERNQPHMLPYTIEPDLVEIPFDVPLSDIDSSIRFVGRIDALVDKKDQPDRPDRKPLRLVLDNKSTGKHPIAFFKQFHMSSQLSGYVFAAKKLFPEYDISSAYINMISTQTVPNSNRKCKTHGTVYAECGWLHPPHKVDGPFNRSDGQLEEWRIDAYNLASEWREHLLKQYKHRDMTMLPMDGQFQYDECNRCELLDFCRSGRPPYYEWQTLEWLPGDLADNPPAERYIWEGTTLCLTGDP